MYHVRNRVYDAENGRWTRRDPLGYVDGMGLYEYCRSGPKERLDAMGLRCVTSHCPNSLQPVVSSRYSNRLLLSTMSPAFMRFETRCGGTDQQPMGDPPPEKPGLNPAPWDEEIQGTLTSDCSKCPSNEFRFWPASTHCLNTPSFDDCMDCCNIDARMQGVAYNQQYFCDLCDCAKKSPKADRPACRDKALDDLRASEREVSASLTACKDRCIHRFRNDRAWPRFRPNPNIT